MKVNNDATSIRKELNKLNARRNALQKQLNRLESLDNERLDKVQRLTETYKPKFANIQTDLVYNKEMEYWKITPKNEEELAIKHYLHELKEEDMDKILNNLDAALTIRKLVPDFELRSVSFRQNMAYLYKKGDNISLHVTREDDIYAIKLIKKSDDDFYTFKLGDNLILEASSEEDYVSLKFIYQFTDTPSGVATGIKRGLKELSKYPN